MSAVRRDASLKGRATFVRVALLLFAVGGANVAWAGLADALRDAGRSQIDFTKVAAAPTMVCGALRQRTTFDSAVISAELVPSTPAVPEHCKVHGVIQPEVQFWIYLPTSWNGRLYMHGGGGYAGASPEFLTSAPKFARAIENKFAVTYTNTGHDATDEPLGTFALNNFQKEIDYFYRAVHLTAVVAKELIGVYYKRAPSYSYWDGCSTGGRQGLMEAQRFPDDFDGILTGAPVHEFTGLHTWYAWLMQALTENPVRLRKVEQLVGPKVYEMCDALDGLKDGSIEDPRRCSFDPARDLSRCAAGTSRNDCITDGEVTTLQKLFGGVRSNGKLVFPGLPVAAEPAGLIGTGTAVREESGWRRFIMDEAGAPADFPRDYGTTFWRYLGFPVDDQNFDPLRLDFDKHVPGLERLRHGVLDATVADLTAFKKRRGKMITYYGWADTGVFAQTAIDYYENVEKTMGGSPRDFYRLFLVPGMFHCQGGFGTDTFDAMTPLINWVEKGIAPDSIHAEKIRDEKVVRSRPLCPYPLIAKYRGTGNIDDAASFSCAQHP